MVVKVSYVGMERSVLFRFDGKLHVKTPLLYLFASWISTVELCLRTGRVRYQCICKREEAVVSACHQGEIGIDNSFHVVIWIDRSLLNTIVLSKISRKGGKREKKRNC
jgi:hypothetical protein